MIRIDGITVRAGESPDFVKCAARALRIRTE